MSDFAQNRDPWATDGTEPFPSQNVFEHDSPDDSSGHAWTTDGDEPLEKENVFERYEDAARQAPAPEAPHPASLGERLRLGVAGLAARPTGLRLSIPQRRGGTVRLSALSGAADRREPSRWRRLAHGGARTAAIAASAAVVALIALSLRGEAEPKRTASAEGRSRAPGLPRADRRDAPEDGAPHKSGVAIKRDRGHSRTSGHRRPRGHRRPAQGGDSQVRQHRYRRALGVDRPRARDRRRGHPHTGNRTDAAQPSPPTSPVARPDGVAPSPPPPRPVNPAAGDPAATEFGFEG